jgi:hypothetical protein
MIDITQAGFSWPELEAVWNSQPTPMLFESLPTYQTNVLGADGNPMFIQEKRQPIGFVLRKKGGT